MGAEKILSLSIPEEVEGPAEGVADQIGGKAAVQSGEATGTVIAEEGAED